MLAGCFNAQEGEKLLDTFLNQHKLHSINKNPTCYKNASNLSNKDLILTNSSKCFCRSDPIFRGLSDFHQLIMSVFKATFKKPKLKEIVYRNYRKFNESNVNQDLHNQTSSVQPKQYASFKKVFLSILEEHAPLKNVTRCKGCSASCKNA